MGEADGGCKASRRAKTCRTSHDKCLRNSCGIWMRHKRIGFKSLRELCRFPTTPPAATSALVSQIGATGSFDWTLWHAMLTSDDISIGWPWTVVMDSCHGQLVFADGCDNTVCQSRHMAPTQSELEGRLLAKAASGDRMS